MIIKNNQLLCKESKVLQLSQDTMDDTSSYPEVSVNHVQTRTFYAATAEDEREMKNKCSG